MKKITILDLIDSAKKEDTFSQCFTIENPLVLYKEITSISRQSLEVDEKERPEQSSCCVSPIINSF